MELMTQLPGVLCAMGHADQKRMRAQHLRQIALLIRSSPTNDLKHLNSQQLDLLCVGCPVVSNGHNAFGELQAIILCGFRIDCPLMGDQLPSSVRRRAASKPMPPEVSQSVLNMATIERSITFGRGLSRISRTRSSASPQAYSVASARPSDLTSSMSFHRVSGMR